MEITSMKQFLELDPEALKAEDPPDWEVLFGQLHVYSSSLLIELKARQERHRLGLNKHLGIARNLSEQLKAYATACYCGATIGKPQSFRPRAVQESIKGKHSAWHAASIAAGRLNECPCFNCRLKQSQINTLAKLGLEGATAGESLRRAMLRTGLKQQEETQ